MNANTLHPDIKSMQKSGQVFMGNETDRYAPSPKAACHVCNRNTPTAFLPLSSGHFGNCCAICRTCRKGRPFATRREYEQHLNAAERQEVHAHDHAAQ